MLQTECLPSNSASIQSRTSPDEFAVRLGLASPDVGSFLSWPGDGVPLPLDATPRDLLECDADDLALANHRAAAVA